MRIPFFVAFVAASLALPVAQANQVDLHLMTGAGECVFRTDTDGLTPKTGGNASPGALGATGNFIDACAGGGSQTPPSDAQIELLVPSSYVEGSSTPLALTWRASADHCALALPPNWSGTPSQLCSSAQACFAGGTADLNTTAGEGIYEVGLKCSRDGGDEIVKKKPVQVTVEDDETPPPVGCPTPSMARHAKGTLQWSGWGTVYNHDLVQFHQAFGRRNTPSDGLQWPQIDGNLLIFSHPKNHYIALQFKVPSSGAKPIGRNQLVSGHSIPQVQNGKLSYSECPGDFGQAASTLPSQCLYSGGFGSGNIFWQTTGIPPSQCHLEPGGTYYLNIASECTLTTCQFSMNNWFSDTQSAGEILGIDVLDQIGWPDD